jgi:hypothetical protein
VIFIPDERDGRQSHSFSYEKVFRKLYLKPQIAASSRSGQIETKKGCDRV